MQTVPPLPSSETAQNPAPTTQGPNIEPQQPPINRDPPLSPKNPITFASLFKENRNLAKCLPLDQDVMCEEGETIVALEDDLLTIEEAFGHSLLGCVIGGVAFPRLIQNLIKSWEVECTYSTHANGWILFQFGTKDEKEKVLRNGPYSVMGRQWLIKDVPKLFSFKDSCFASVPIWINLRFLPKQCWSKALLSRIARKIGKPIAMDVVTGDKTKHEGARILVEVDLGKTIVDKVSILMPDGRTWDQGVDYEIKPVLCKSCKGLGHEDCKRADPPTNLAPRRRSRSRVRWNMQKEKLKDGEVGSSAPKPNTPILTALPSDKGKGILHDGADPTSSKMDTPQDWQLVASPTTLASDGPRVSHECESVAKGLKSINDVIAEILPVSPNFFAPLFEEDERAPLAKRVEEEVLEGNSAKNPGARFGNGVKEEDLRRSGRRRRAISSS